MIKKDKRKLRLEMDEDRMTYLKSCEHSSSVLSLFESLCDSETHASHLHSSLGSGSQHTYRCCRCCFHRCCCCFGWSLCWWRCLGVCGGVDRRRGRCMHHSSFHRYCCCCCCCCRCWCCSNRCHNSYVIITNRNDDEQGLPNIDFISLCGKSFHDTASKGTANFHSHLIHLN